jgi:hypothetical protein
MRHSYNSLLYICRWANLAHSLVRGCLFTVLHITVLQFGMTE